MTVCHTKGYIPPLSLRPLRSVRRNPSPQPTGTMTLPEFQSLVAPTIAVPINPPRWHRDLELTTAMHNLPQTGRHAMEVEVIDIFGNHTMTLVSATAG